MRLGTAAFAAFAMGACTPQPGSIPFDGGTFSVDVTVPPQTFSVDYLVCTTTATTDAINLTGATVTIPPISIDPSLSVISVPSATVDIPAGTSAAGSLTLTCFDRTFGPVEIQLSLAGSVTTQTATLNTATKTITLSSATLTLDGASIVIPGIRSIALPPIDVSLGSITISY
ncbi:MAG: hypothetical protein ACKO04_06730 [Actinomycetes bacterium]